LTNVTDDRWPRMDFAEFMAVHQRPMLRFAAALCANGRLAEDIVADVFGRVFEGWQRISSVERPEAYVRRMVLNEFISRKRRERRTTVVASVNEYAELAPDHAHRHAEHDALKSRMAALLPRQRAALVLRYYEDMTDPEIADVLGCATGTVRSLISRALAILRVPTEDREPARAAAVDPRSFARKGTT
jgi:RNA polymerase sigma-70 factor (sigma-E family)